MFLERAGSASQPASLRARQHLARGSQCEAGKCPTDAGEEDYINRQSASQSNIARCQFSFKTYQHPHSASEALPLVLTPHISWHVVLDQQVVQVVGDKEDGGGSPLALGRRRGTPSWCRQGSSLRLMCHSCVPPWRQWLGLNALGALNMQWAWLGSAIGRKS